MTAYEQELNRIVRARLGVELADLPDVDTAGMEEDGLSPIEAFYTLLEELPEYTEADDAPECFSDADPGL